MIGPIRLGLSQAGVLPPMRIGTIRYNPGTFLPTTNKLHTYIEK